MHGVPDRLSAGRLVEAAKVANEVLEERLFFGGEPPGEVAPLQGAVHAPVRPGASAGGWVRAGCARLCGGHEASPFVVRVPGAPNLRGAICVAKGTFPEIPAHV